MNCKAKILIVDDVPDHLLLLCTLLEEQGYRVYLACEGASILKKVDNLQPDLILLDICLSEMDGYQICYHLKNNSNTQDIPIIFISALEDIKNKIKGFKMGGADYITKPFQVEEVIARIENQLIIQQQKNELNILQKELLEKNKILERKNSHLELLLQLIKVMNSAEMIDDAIAEVLKQVCQVINWSYGEAWTLNSEKTTLERSNSWYAHCPILGNFDHQVKTELSVIQKEFVENIAVSKKIIWLSNFEQLHSLQFSKSPVLLQKAMQLAGLHRMLGIPITFQKNVLAVLIFLDSSDCDQRGASFTIFPQDGLVLIQSIADQLGALMQRLYTEVELKKANEELQKLVSYDSLTVIANRRRFDEYLDEQWRQGKRDRGELSLILCDLDCFKLYNDNLGHQAGDKCLQAVASMIKQVVKRPMDLVARYGGEELAVIVPYTSQIGALQLAEKIREAVKGLQIPHPNSPVSYYVTVSVGVSSLIPRDNCSQKLLIKLADEALYQAKEMGRDRVVLKNQFSEL